MNDETVRAGVQRLKALAALRNPCFDLPADSHLGEAVKDILRLAGEPPPTARIADDMAAKLDALLAPLVAEGGELSKQHRPDGTDLYYVDGALRLKLGPVVSKTEAGPAGGTLLHFTRSVTRYSRPD